MKVEFSHDEMRYGPESRMILSIKLLKELQDELLKHIKVRK